jgi:GNAT superfamily N-acetyltransferase
MNITTRLATPEDVGFLARIMERSMLPAQGAGLFDDLAASIELDRLAFHEAVLLAGANNWGQLSDFIVVEYDGEPAAATSAHLSSMGDVRPITAKQLMLVSKYLDLPPERSKRLLQTSIMKFGAFGDTPHFRDPAEYVVEYAAVMPAFAGKQLSRYLFGAHIKRALDLGCRTLGTRALVGNDAALNAWQRLGLRYHSTVSADQAGAKSIGIQRLVLDLTDLPEGYEPGEPLPSRPADPS